MSERDTDLPMEPQSIHDPGFHHSGTIVEFSKEDVEASIAAKDLRSGLAILLNVEMWIAFVSPKNQLASIGRGHI